MPCWKQPVPLGRDVHDPDDSCHDKGMDHDVAETDRRTHKKLAKHCLQAPVDLSAGLIAPFEHDSGAVVLTWEE
jgi:hypothetical protein